MLSRMYFLFFDMKRIAPYILLVALFGVFFGKQITGGEVWYCCDNLLINVPSKVFLIRELSLGRFPIWNPYIFSGTPFWADINLAILHPNTLLYFFFSPFRALTIGILSSYIVASFGMYVLGRTFRLGRFASVAGAVVFGFSGSLIVYANNIPLLQVAVLVPWVCAVWVKYMEHPTGKQLAWFVATSSLQIFSGHPQLTYYTWLMLFVYTIVKKPGFQSVKHSLKAATLVALMTSVQLVPFISFMLDSTRIGQDFATAASGSIHPLSLLRLLLPGMVGNLSGGTAWIQAGSMHGYVGFIPLLLIPIAWKSGRTGKFFIAIAIFSLLMVMGKFTPVYGLAYYLIPAFSFFREPGQFLFLSTFGMAVGVMAAVEALLRKSERARYMQVIGIVFLLAAGIVFINQSGMRQEIASWQFLPDRLLTKLTALPDRQWRVIMDGIVFNLSFFGLSGLLAGFAVARMHRSRVARILFLGILCSELWVYGQTNVTTIVEATVTGWQEEAGKRAATWKLTEGDGYRYYTDPVIYPYPDKKPFGQWNDPGESQWQFKILRPSLGMLYGIGAVDGYASMVLRSYQQKFAEFSRDPTGVSISSIVDPRLSEAGVRYIITKPNNPTLADTKQYHLLAADEKSAVYENTKAEPVARTASPPLGVYVVGSLFTLAGFVWCLKESQERREPTDRVYT